MTRTRGRQRSKQGLGYSLILVVLGQVTIMMAPTRAAQLSGIAIIVLVVLDAIAGWINFLRLKIVVCVSGTYSSGDTIPVDIVSSRPLHVSKNRMLLHHTPIGRPEFSSGDRAILNHTVTLERGRYQALPYTFSEQSPLGLCTFAKQGESKVDLFIGPSSQAISTEHLPDHELELAGVRPAQSGDPRRLVHWPSTARAQELMVKDRMPVDAAESSSLLIVLDLGYLQDEASESAAGRARAYAERAIGLGYSVDIMVCTTTGQDRKSKSSRPSTAGAVTSVTRTSVTSSREILQILAQADGAIAAKPAHDGRLVHVTQSGDLWSGF